MTWEGGEPPEADQIDDRHDPCRRGFVGALQEPGFRSASGFAVALVLIAVVLLTVDLGTSVSDQWKSNIRLAAGVLIAVALIGWAFAWWGQAIECPPDPSQEDLGTGNGRGTGDGSANVVRKGWVLASDDPRFRWSTGLALAVLAAGVFLLLLDAGAQLSENEQDNIHALVVVLMVLTVVGWALNWLRIAREKRTRPAGADDWGESAASNMPIRVQLQLFEECDAMIAYALQRGMAINADDVKTLQDADQYLTPRQEDDASSWWGYKTVYREWPPDLTKRLANAHRRLSMVVAPAMPKTLALLNRGVKTPIFPWLGSVRLVRMMVGLVVVLIPLFVASAINVGTRLDQSAGLFEGNALEKVETALYLIVAAALGAAFAGLFKAFRYIGNLSYDEKYESSYWLRFILGVVAGLILAVVIAQAAFSDTSSAETQFRITVPLLALVGGFSSDLVYRILKRLLDAIETLIQGSASELLDAQKQESDSRLKAQALEATEDFVTKLLDVQEKLPADAVAARARIQQILAEQFETDAQPVLAVVSPSSGAQVAPGEPVVIVMEAEPKPAPGDVAYSVEPTTHGRLVPDPEDPLKLTFTAEESAAGGTVALAFTLADAPTTVRLELQVTARPTEDDDTADGGGVG